MKGSLAMKKVFLLGLSVVLAFLPSCVNEKPEPVYVPETVEKERTLLYAQEISGIEFTFYSDDTAEVTGLAEGTHGQALTLPDKIGETPIVGIGVEAFRGSEYTEITLPSTVKTIGDRAFQKSHLTKITLPDSVESLGKEAFDNCLRLQEVTFGTGLRDIPLGCFFGCSQLKKVTLPEGVESVGEEAFASLSSLEEISLPATLKTIGAFAFWNSGKTALSVTVPAGVESVGEEAFSRTEPHQITYHGENESVKSALGLA